jgi:hypothetical protein
VDHPTGLLSFKTSPQGCAKPRPPFKARHLHRLGPRVAPLQGGSEAPHSTEAATRTRHRTASRGVVVCLGAFRERLTPREPPCRCAKTGAQRRRSRT